MGRVWRFLLALIVVVSVASAQLSDPAALKTAVEANKYRSKTPADVENFMFGTEGTQVFKKGQCHHEIDLLWTTEVGASIYATPIITDLFSDGVKDLLIPTYTHFVEAVKLNNGHRTPGWPYVFQDSTFQGSPIMYDIDADGTLDILLVTTNGEIVFLREDGTPIFNETLKVPPLAVKKDWYVGFDEHKTEVHVNLHPSRRRLMADDPVPDDPTTMWAGFGGWLSDEARDSLEILLPGEAVKESSSGPSLLESIHYERYHPKDVYKDDPKKVNVDPHVLASATLADLDGDGGRDLIVPVSYYFDRNLYSDAVNAPKIDPTIDIKMYVAGGLVVFDLERRDIKFSVHLDLTTDTTHYRGYIYSQPSVADIDGDGKQDIVVGTSVGFIYALERDGALKKQFPVMMDEVQGQVVLADINNDGKIEIVGVDKNANVVAFNSKGEEVWENRISGQPVQGATIGDVNGDGLMDVIIGTNVGHIWALNGVTGAYMAHFPVRTGGKVMAPVTLAKLDSESKGLHLVVTSFDGHLFVIDGITGCVEKVDLGEAGYSQVLIDDVTGNGMLDIIVTTSSGAVYALSTESRSHPLYSWGAQVHGFSGTMYRGDYHGIFAIDDSRSEVGAVREFTGQTMSVHFEIVDKRQHVQNPFNPANPPNAHAVKYNVTISFGAGSPVLFNQEYTSSGVYTATFPVESRRMAATLVLSMQNEYGLVYEDWYPISLNVHFYKSLKWLVALPFIAMAVSLIFFREFTGTALPT